MKQAILVVSFGTAHRDALDKNIAAIERDMAASFPGWAVRRAFTSGRIVRKLQERDGLTVETPPEALSRLAEEGFEQAVIQPTHVLRGEEYEKLLSQAEPFRGRFRGLAVGRPLLSGAGDCEAAAEALAGVLPESKPGQAVVLMGHGSPSGSNAVYPTLEDALHRLGRADVRIGTVEARPGLDEVLAGLRESGDSSAALLPLMVVAGDHAKNDMAGEGPDSWKSRLTAAGFQVRCELRGLGEAASVRALFTAHAADAAETLD